MEENPAEYLEKEICPLCPWGKEISNPLIYKLLDYITLLEAGCPVERHELTDFEWKAIAILKTEQQKIITEENKEKWQQKYQEK